MRRGLERYAPTEGYDPGSQARDKISQIIVRKAGIFPGDWVLDVETRTGLLGVNLGRSFTRAKVIATDSDRAQLEKARENAKAEGCEARMRFVQCLPEALPIKDETSYFSTMGLALAEQDEPLDVLDEIHRVTGFYGKVYIGAVDLRSARKKVRGMKTWIFGDDTLAAMREIGFGKVQVQQVAILAGGGRLMLVTAKRFDAEGEEGDEEEEDDELDE